LETLYSEAMNLLSLLKQSHNHLESTVKLSEMDHLAEDLNKTTLTDEEVMDNQVITGNNLMSPND
jgi:hypothetical protein